MDISEPGTSNQDQQHSVKSSTSSQISGPTNEPVAYTYNEYQEPMDISEPGTSNQDQQHLVKSSTSNQDQQHLVKSSTSSQDKQHSVKSSTSSQISGPTNEPNTDTYNEYQEPMDISEPGTSNQDKQHSVKSSTSSQISGPTNEPVAYTYNEYQEPMDISESGTSNQDQQHLVKSSTFNQDKQHSVKSSTSSQVSSTTNEPNTDTSNEYQEPMDISEPGTSNQDQQHSVKSSTSNQDKKQSMDKEPGNTGSNQVTELGKQDQMIFDDMKKRLVAFKEIQKKKRKEYSEYKTAGRKQQSGLEKGENISGSRHDPEFEKKLKQEYIEAITRVFGVQQELKAFMERYGLEFKEPNSN
ncbi:hypothetical protein BATDEDRAFT_89823 [Batrachochytrium dendrobatidis JAM81]|uniref:Uncharacterized protein n=1 Tax=Batrachochytrium dendrobatidis (strain JAM81 / FGSC 10211) TaxID=684364 RepID=F4P5A1_BATDJ|nr:uncharacterized protein BATDEDRAFT_89823 [Batrachochytrium dendrobatidis JAM81]EGF79377.1 hypothetical protein BATDEDRAFT_89823 [Batrachochytrium dendrobatidis JAM81]|eukprot:XP_006680129.1 hypothetical protein BATDEDRAFT_89823 [Batrachochytrium dendrobatidis JAM81]